MVIRNLTMQQIHAVYETHMGQDFPASELKPLSSIERMLQMGNYICTGLFEKEELVAYAFFVRADSSRCVLLDYLAVCRDHRSKGIGRIYMAQMREHFPDIDGFLIECESEYSATPKELPVRRRRIRFYEGCGAILTEAKSWLFGVDYSILYFPVRRQYREVDGYRELGRIYDAMFSREQRAERLHSQIDPVNTYADEYADMVRLWRRQRILRQVDTARRIIPQANLCAALGINMEHPPKVISLVGGGGKTSTMFTLADELAEQGRRVIVTTSTHIQVTDRETLQPGITVAGNPGPDGRLTSPDSFTELMRQSDVLLVEADGAKQLPFKIPAQHEPVIIPETEWVIACVGMDAVGKTFEQACFRTELACARLGKMPADVITPADVAKVLAAEWGAKKGVEMDGKTSAATGASGMSATAREVGTTGSERTARVRREYRIVLNKADTPERRAAAESVAEELVKYGIMECVVSAYQIVTV